MRHKCYLSGPISGKCIVERRKTFKSAQVMLESAGYYVVNPMENGLPKESTTAQHMKRDIQLLTECDTVFMMDGWVEPLTGMLYGVHGRYSNRV